MDAMKKSYRVVLFSAVVMVVTSFLYIVLFEIMIRQAPQLGALKDTLGPSAYVILLALAAASALLAEPVRKFFMSRAGLMTTPSWPLPFQKDIPQSARKTFSAIYVMFAMFHTMAIFGLLLSFFTGNRVFVYLGAALVVALGVIRFPRYEQWEEWVRSAEGAEGPR